MPFSAYQWYTLDVALKSFDFSQYDMVVRGRTDMIPPHAYRDMLCDSSTFYLSGDFMFMGSPSTFLTLLSGMFRSLRCSSSERWWMFASPPTFISHIIGIQKESANNISLRFMRAFTYDFSERHQFSYNVTGRDSDFCVCRQARWLKWYTARGISVLQLSLTGERTLLVVRGFATEIWNALYACDKIVLINMSALPTGFHQRDSSIMSCVPLQDKSATQNNVNSSLWVRPCGRPDFMMNYEWNASLCLCAPVIDVADALVSDSSPGCWLP